MPQPRSLQAQLQTEVRQCGACTRELQLLCLWQCLGAGSGKWSLLLPMASRNILPLRIIPRPDTWTLPIGKSVVMTARCTAPAS